MKITKEKIKKNAANIITGFRIIGTAVMAFQKTLSNEFFAAYIFAGVTDLLDGFVARKTNSVSAFGSKLDSVSDLFFFTVMMIKVMPYLVELLPKIVWINIYLIVICRVLLYLCIAFSQHRLLSNHTILNKATGLSMFFIPFMLKTDIFVGFAVCVVLVAWAAVIYETAWCLKNKKNSKTGDASLKINDPSLVNDKAEEK